MAISRYASPIGRLTIVTRGDLITQIRLNGQEETPLEPEKHLSAENGASSGTQPLPKHLEVWLDRYFSGEKPDALPPLEFPLSTPFRAEVWAVLCRIPYGKLVTYGDISRFLECKTGRRVSARAVGGAVRHNPIAVVVPCHRVVGSDGSLTGYAGGLEKKIALLRLEGVDPDMLAADPKRYRFDL